MRQSGLSLLTIHAPETDSRLTGSPLGEGAVSVDATWFDPCDTCGDTGAWDSVIVGSSTGGGNWSLCTDSTGAAGSRWGAEDEGAMELIDRLQPLTATPSTRMNARGVANDFSSIFAPLTAAQAACRSGRSRHIAHRCARNVFTGLARLSTSGWQGQPRIGQTW